MGTFPVTGHALAILIIEMTGLETPVMSSCHFLETIVFQRRAVFIVTMTGLHHFQSPLGLSQTSGIQSFELVLVTFSAMCTMISELSRSPQFPFFT